MSTVLIIFNYCFYLDSFYTGYEGTYNTSQLNEIVRLINSTCKIIITILILMKFITL
ncbi:unnamed protein product [Schistosoma margrebowiei]|uniref:Uncharacterized protein n=1 Tax=Schistosoma margrebowiei TaxID=48269 RepID=A0AA85A6V2_9TREM|nr:unnamed protein product [Schistosoma margrebowiei]